MHAVPHRLAPWRRSSQARLAGTLAATLWAGVALTSPAFGQESPLGADIEVQIRQLVSSGTANAMRAGGSVSRVDVEFGTLDPRLRLAPCAKVEPYLPGGMRLAGKARIGLRCLKGATRWNVYMPITVKIFGPALVANAALPAGSVLGAADVHTAEIDLAEDNSAAVTVVGEIVGRILARPLGAGEGVRQNDLKVRQWFAAGETVNVVAVGSGFAVEAEGVAMTNGVEGQPARVRTESGRVVTGMPTAQRRVEFQL
ncbi:MAG: flagellar biosynthesis protein FlgA [Rhizobacter sp.]|nr:flagellar biosynthesis protein FlgA [Rhizobacter sp.]